MLRSVRVLLGPLGASWGLLGPFGASWSLLEPLGAEIPDHHLDRLQDAQDAQKGRPGRSDRLPRLPGRRQEQFWWPFQQLERPERPVWAAWGPIWAAWEPGKPVWARLTWPQGDV